MIQTISKKHSERSAFFFSYQITVSCKLNLIHKIIADDVPGCAVQQHPG
jgi:hypothetical protein